MLTDDDRAVIAEYGITLDGDDEFWLELPGGEQLYGGWLAANYRDPYRIRTCMNAAQWDLPTSDAGKWVLVGEFNPRNDPPGRQRIGAFDDLRALLAYAALHGRTEYHC